MSGPAGNQPGTRPGNRPGSWPGARRRILIVSPVVPHPPMWGFSTRIRHLATQLGRTADVSLLCYREPGDDSGVAALEGVFESIHTVPMVRPPERHRRRAQVRAMLSTTPYQVRRLRSAALQQALDAVLRDSHYDIVQFETAHLAWLKTPPGVARVLDEHNIEYELFRRMCRQDRTVFRKAYYGAEAAKLYRDERRQWRRADGCVTTSERELAIMQRHAPGTPLAVVPNGVDLGYFRRDPTIPVEPGRLVFTGLLDYRPNEDAALYFIRSILPLIQQGSASASVAASGFGTASASVDTAVGFTAAGQGVTEALRELTGPDVETTGWVADMRPHFSRAAAVVVPLRMGSGTRLKVLEALAMSRPVVSTSLGCEGIDVRHREHLLIADDAESFAEQVSWVLANPGPAQEIADRGRALVEARYGWEAVGERLTSLHSAVLGGRSRPASDAPSTNGLPQTRS